MQIIKTIADQVTDEINGAREYAKQALTLKDDNKDTAGMYYKLAEEELGHVARLHDAVVGMIREYRDKNGAPPEAMLAVYNYLHERNIESVAEVRTMLDLYRK